MNSLVFLFSLLLLATIVDNTDAQKSIKTTDFGHYKCEIKNTDICGIADTTANFFRLEVLITTPSTIEQEHLTYHWKGKRSTFKLFDDHTFQEQTKRFKLKKKHVHKGKIEGYPPNGFDQILVLKHKNEKICEIALHLYEYGLGAMVCSQLAISKE